MSSDPGEKQVLTDIAKHGWSGIIVLQDDEGPGFEYTIGLLAQHNHPEMIVFGLPPDTTHDLLWQAYRQVCDGKDYSGEGVYDDLLESYLCKIQPVHKTWHSTFFGYALWYRKHVAPSKSFAAVQVMWPDRQGRFPSDKRCLRGVRNLQPDLSKPRATG